MKVLKFGGSSVGSLNAITEVGNIIKSSEGPLIVVSSAMSGVTDMMVRYVSALRNKQDVQKTEILNQIKVKHFDFIDALIDDDEVRRSIKYSITKKLLEFDSYRSDLSESDVSEIITLGEFFLTRILSNYIRSLGVANTLLDSRKFMFLNKDKTPDIGKISVKLKEELSFTSRVHIAQGFVCNDYRNRISHLERGGSDYSATIIGAAIEADEIQIWSDVDGVLNNDPRYVKEVHPIPYLSYQEASKLAYFGAKILHPKTMNPIVEKGIPLYIKNTFNSNCSGTRIYKDHFGHGIKAISGKDHLVFLTINNSNGVPLNKFMKDVINVMNRFDSTIDIVTTSFDKISLVLEDSDRFQNIVNELEEFSNVEFDKNQSIICLVGKLDTSECIFNIIEDIPYKSISLDNKNNLNVLVAVNTTDKIQSLEKLNQRLFANEELALLGVV